MGRNSRRSRLQDNVNGRDSAIGKYSRRGPQHVSAQKRTFLAISILAIFVWGCIQHAPAPAKGKEAALPDIVEPAKDPRGLTFTLAEGTPDSGEHETVQVVKALPLTSEQVQAVLARLPQFTHQAEQTDFAVRERSLPAPKTGDKIAQPFPPTIDGKAGPDIVAGSLEVLRQAPEGEVPIAPQLSVTFNQPMVALTSHAELAKLERPVKLSPEPPGTWRWIGTKTLLFDPRGEVSSGSEQQARFPMATEYTVEVPAGVKSASGEVLAQSVRWTFKTPTVTLKSSSPNGGPHGLEPTLWAIFDQDIDPRKVMPTVAMKGGDAVVPLRLATAEEVTGARLDRLQAKRLLAFKSVEPLRPATNYTVTIGPGTPSEEGPLTSAQPQSFSFSTYQPLQVTHHSCGYNNNCPPLTPFSIRFNNPLDAEKFEPGMVTVTPEIPGMKVDVAGNSMVIRGQTKGQTTYTVTLSSSLPDQFGQSLGRSAPLTFDVGTALPNLMAMGDRLVTLDPDGPPSYPIYVINEPELKVRIHSVEPKDWTEFSNRLARQTYEQPFVSPGQQVVNTTIKTGAKTDELTEVPIDLKPALSNGKGMAVVEVESTRAVEHHWQRKKVVAWVQVTDVGLDAAADQNSMLVLATSLKSGKPLSQVRLELLKPDGAVLVSEQTTSDGTAQFGLPGEQAPTLVARAGADVSILPHQVNYWGSGGWQKGIEIDQLRWFVVDDRKMYRPDEKVSIKGWMRRWQAGPKGDVIGLQGEVSSLSWTLNDSRGNEVLKGTTEVSTDGSFSLQMDLPKTMNLGHANLRLSATSSISGGSHNHSFQVQEFRRPEFEVSARVSPDFGLVGESAVATVEAKYYAGGGLPSAPVHWSVTTSPGSYTPPGRSDFTFGTWVPWWSWSGADSSLAGRSSSQSLQGRTDSAGAHHLNLEFASVEPPRPTVVRAEASVTDVNRQAWNSTATLLVHPSDSYVGLRSQRLFVEKGKPIEIEVLACHRDGSILEGRSVELAAWRMDYKFERGRYITVKEDVQRQTIRSGSSPQVVRFQPSAGGTYTVKARILDDEGRPNESSLTVWVSGAERPAARQVEKEEVTLIPNAKEYRAGEVAEVMVQAPFYPAEGVMTLRRTGLLKSERFSMDGPTTVLKIPIEEGLVPNVHLQVDLSGTAPREESRKTRPAYASGTLNLSVPPYARTLAVEVIPAHPGTDPGAHTSLGVKVTDAAGKPVANAEVALFAVDEAVLSLTGYTFPDPVGLYYAQRSANVSDYRSRQYVLLTQLDELSKMAEEAESTMDMEGGAPRGALRSAAMAPAPASEMRARGNRDDAKAEAQQGPPIAVRTDFNPTALFAPLVTTDASGRASVPFKLPDNLTRYRLVALATDGGQQFGKGESALTARLPLMVRPSPPRFLNFGDTFELPIVLQNQTDSPMEVQVAGRAANVVFTEAAGFRVTVPANDRVEVRFPAATEQAGIAVFQVGAVAGGVADAAEFKLPVWTPATTEAFATYGELDQGAISQPVLPPKDVFPQFGGLEVTTSSTALASLTDAMVYLVSYPFDCAEQVSSRVWGIAALRDVLWAFEAEGMPDAESLNEQVAKDLERLSMLQSHNGGFGFWATSGETWPYISVHVAHAIARSKEKDYEVPERLLSRSRSYLQNVESHIPAWYSIEAKRMIRAYAIYVRHRMGDRDLPKAHALIQEAGGVDKLPLEAVGWLTTTMAGDSGSERHLQAVRHLLNQKITETAGNAHFVTSWSEDSGYLVLASDRRVDGILLEAMIADQPKSDLIPKIARGLLAHRKRGRWSNTQDNCFVLLALDKYFHTYEGVTPDFVARVWLGEQFAGEQTFKGREVDSKSVSIPMAYLADKGQQDLVLAKEGQGRLYYRLAMDYAPKSLKLDPADHGFAVERSYLAIDDPSDVKRDDDGTWRIKAGSRVQVKLTMVAPARRYHVALVDPLPAGLEPMNPALAVTGTIPLSPSEQQSRGRFWYWMGTWYEHQNMRDERVEAFTSLLWGGVYSYSYAARATTPGDFVVPPTKAEEMYAPETFGRSASDRVIVE